MTKIIGILPLKATQEVISKNLFRNKNDILFVTSQLLHYKSFTYHQKLYGGCLLGTVKCLSEFTANPKAFVSITKATDIRN